METAYNQCASKDENPFERENRITYVVVKKGAGRNGGRSTDVKERCKMIDKKMERRADGKSGRESMTKNHKKRRKSLQRRYSNPASIFRLVAVKLYRCYTVVLK